MKTSLFILLIISININSKNQLNGAEKLTVAKVFTPMSLTDSIELATECRNRRETLTSHLGNGVVIINNNEDTKDNFRYLSGWTGQPSSLVLNISDNPSFDLFVLDPSPVSILWNGIQPGNKEAKLMGANPYNFYEFKKHLKTYIKEGKKIFLLKQDKVVKDQLKGLLVNKADSERIVYIDTILSEIRIIKNEYETGCIRKAIKITETALTNSLCTIKPGMYEYELAALFNYEYARNGTTEAFPSIIGSGENATTLHYEANNNIIKSNVLVLMDVGAKFNGYAADITRTIPSSGKFSQKQLTLYNLVLKAQEEGLKVMKPGCKILDFHNQCTKVLTEGLFRLGFITDTTKDWQKEVFILYQAGHYLGLDVHDVGKYLLNSLEYTRVKSDSRGRELIPGMVITIEPGIYINPNMLSYIYSIFGEKVPKKELDAYVAQVKPVFEQYANIGIRIEDDVLITPSGNEVLSFSIPKLPAEIEKMMQKK